MNDINHIYKYKQIKTRRRPIGLADSSCSNYRIYIYIRSHL